MGLGRQKGPKTLHDALPKLWARMNGRGPVDTDRLRDVVEACLKELAETQPDFGKKVQAFRLYWGFTDGRHQILEDVGAELGMSISRTHDVIGQVIDEIEPQVHEQYAAR